MKTYNALEFASIGSKMGLFEKEWCQKMLKIETKKTGKTSWSEKELYDYYRIYEITQDFYNRKFSDYVHVRDRKLYGYNEEEVYD